MTEAEWLTCTAPTKMVRHLARGASPRKLRLYGVACCRRIWDLLGQDHWRAAVDLAERFADDEATAADLDEAHAAVNRDISDSNAARVDAETPQFALQWLTTRGEPLTWQRAWAWHPLPLVRGALNVDAYTRMAVAALRGPPRPAHAERPTDTRAECRAHAQLIRETFGNPFRKGACDPSWQAWNGGAVGELAHGIYEERAFDRLPVLADALEEAGCAEAALLAHCRQPAEHVRGCWVIDLLLGKE
jgi:hypothetical protein